MKIHTFNLLSILDVLLLNCVPINVKLMLNSQHLHLSILEQCLETLILKVKHSECLKIEFL